MVLQNPQGCYVEAGGSSFRQIWLSVLFRIAESPVVLQNPQGPYVEAGNNIVIFDIE